MRPEEVTESQWAALRVAAKEAMGRAYAPYSDYPVGAAALVDDGRIVVGSNVENVSYGLGLCAECGLVSDLARTGGGRLIAFTCVDALGEPTAPCGRCRQLLYEFGGDSLLLEVQGGTFTMKEILPEAFGPENIEEVRDVEVAEVIEEAEEPGA